MFDEREYQRKWKRNNPEKVRQSRKKYFETHPWSKTLCLIASRCKCNEYYNGKLGRTIGNFLTTKDLKYLWFRDKAFLLQRPSINRIDPSGDYTIGNCKYMELKENQRQPRHIFTRYKTLSPKHKARIKASITEWWQKRKAIKTVKPIKVKE